MGKKKRELLFSLTRKDFKIDYFSGTGSGGQYRNRHKNCVRLQHIETGIIVTGQSNRNRQANIKEAFNNLLNHPRFKLWFNRKINEKLSGKTVEQIVEEMMKDEYLKVEGKDEKGNWVEIE